MTSPYQLSGLQKSLFRPEEAFQWSILTKSAVLVKGSCKYDWKH